jgi:hypothetical protein
MKTNLSPILRLVLAAALVLLAVLSALQMIPPRAVPADAPAARFSAGRAMADLGVVASEPHAAGSEAQARVRAYIIDQVKALGLNAEVETSGQLANILVRIPGSDPSLAVLVSGHYDSHPPSPGAGDDGISVAAMLESLRVLHASPALRNDILFLFTDGEELGWKGAQAFIGAHPEAKNEVGMLLVFDARPGNAPLSLIKTSPGDGWLLRQMTGIPLSLWAGSWKNLQERSEMDTDYDVFQPAGYTGVVFENEANGTRYHTDLDRVDAISPNLVQAYGQSMLALTRRFGSIDLRARTKAPDLAFFTLSLVGLVAYPYWVMRVLSCLGILAWLGFVIIAWRMKTFSPGRFLLSLLGLLVGILLCVLVAQLAWGGIKGSHAAEVGAFGGFEGSAAWQAGLMAAAGLLMILLLAFLSRRLGGFPLAAASTLLFLLAGFAFNSMTKTENPLTTPWLAWPFLGGVSGMGIMLFTRRPAWKVVLLSLSALLVLAVAVPRIWMGTFTREDAWLTVLVVCVWMELFAPQVEAMVGSALTTERIKGFMRRHA